MNTTFASGIYALLAEEFDDREKRDLTERLEEMLEVCSECMPVDVNVLRGGAYRKEISLLCSLLYYGLNLRSCSDLAVRTPGQEYCNLSLVSPAPNTSTGSGTTLSSAFAALPYYDYMMLCVILSLGQYVLAPSHHHIDLSSSSWRGVLGALSEIHRMFLLVDGRFVTPVHRLLQVRLALTPGADTLAAGQRARPDRKMLVLAWLMAFKLGVQGVPHALRFMQWLWGWSSASRSKHRVDGGREDSSPPLSRRHLTRKCTLCMDFIPAASTTPSSSPSAGSAPATTSCGHIFCLPCIERWLTMQPRCPICRTPQQPQQVRILYNL